MARKTKRGRGRPSFENSYKVRQKAYRQYVRKWKQLNEKYDGNIGLQLDYKDFTIEMREARRRLAEEGKRLTPSRLAVEQVDVTVSQASSAVENFNAHLQEAREKYAQGKELSQYEIEMLDYFGYNKSGLKLTQRDIRAKTLLYDEAYNIAKNNGMGNEAFGS